MLDRQVLSKEEKIEAGSKIANMIIAAQNDLLAQTGEGHPRTSQSIAVLTGSLKQSIDEIGSINFSIKDETLFFQDEALNAHSAIFNPIIDSLSGLGIDGFEFLPGITDEDAGEFLNMISISENHDDPVSTDYAKTLLGHIKVYRSSAADISQSVADGHFDPTVERSDFIEQVGIIMDAAKTGRSFLDETGDLSRQIVDLTARDEMGLLGAVYGHSGHYLDDHTLNVARFTAGMAHLLGIGEDMAVRLTAAALVHDIGMIDLPCHIVANAYRPNDYEMEILKDHPVHGLSKLDQLEGLDRALAVVVFEHHAGYDLSGYPKIERLDGLHVFSRIVAVADAFENGCRRSGPYESMGSIIEGSGREFDPDIVKALVGMLGPYPVGTVVKLNTSEIGVVFANDSADIYDPMLLVVRNDKGLKIDPYLVKANQKFGPIFKAVLKVATLGDYKISTQEFLEE